MARAPDERLRRLASHFEGEVGRTRAERLAASALLRARPYFERPRHRWVLAASSVAAVLLGTLGLGALADQAVPGQVLYPIDRAYESVAGFVGISEDRSEERLVEALALIDRGREVEAVALIDEAIEYLARQPQLQASLLDQTDSLAPSPQPTTTTVPAAPPAIAAPPAAPATPEPPPVIIAAADPSASLRLATESLLRSVREARAVADEAGHEEVGRAASELIAAAEVVRETSVTVPLSDVAGDTTTTSEPPTTSTDSTTTTTEVTDSTTTTTPETTGSTTTTTEVTDSTTTTTEVTGSTTTTTQPGGGPGPIIIPPQP